MGDPEEELTLRVAEAMPKDVGRAIVRLDPRDMERLGASTGQIIEIEGHRRTAVKLMPAYAEERGKGTVQMDGLVRENAGVGLDDEVRVRPAAVQRARQVTLAPTEGGRTRAAPQDTRYLGRLLEGLPAVAGDRVRANPFGTRPTDFLVVEAAPEGITLINGGTIIRVRGEAAAGPQLVVSYEDVGGLSKEIARIREMVELPLRYPEVFDRLGIDPPKGLLLHGPPGCGKTLIARAVAQETAAHFAHANGPEVIHKFYGESEAHLRRLFQEAEEHAPSILFLDEIDAIAPKREEVQGEVEKRVVAQLLASMDGLRSRGQVVVIGATNIPDSIDPALRRPGRFDREMAISVPDKSGRLEILQIHTRGMPLADDVKLERLASITHGFVGADLAALCREAAMACLRGVLSEIDFARAEIPYERLLQLEVTMSHFLEALNEVEPSAIREVFTEVPDVRWEDVGGLEEVRQRLQESVEWGLKYPERFRYAQTQPPKGILLTGPPGTGKTLVAKAIASQTEANFIAVKGPELLSKWVGESEKGVRAIFKKARQTAPCIVFFDEIDALLPTRGAGLAESHVSERVVSQFLSEMDGIEELRGVVVLGATNRPDILDPALTRPGRLELVVEFPAPDREARQAILHIHTRGRPLAPEVDLAALAARTEGLVGAELEALCRRAAILAIRDSVALEPADTFTPFTITAAHFERALAEVRDPQQGRRTPGQPPAGD